MQTDKEEKRREGRIGKKKKICSLKQFLESHKETHEQLENKRGSTSRKPRAEDQIKGCSTEAIQPWPKKMQLKASNAGKQEHCHMYCTAESTAHSHSSVFSIKQLSRMEDMNTSKTVFSAETWWHSGSQNSQFWWLSKSSKKTRMLSVHLYNVKLITGSRNPVLWQRVSHSGAIVCRAWEARILTGRFLIKINF